MKNTHIEHLEDELLNHSDNGIYKIINHLIGIYNFILDNEHNEHNKATITTKWDGSPSFVCGNHPEKNKFFIGTKSVFSKQPIINYSIENIKNNYKEKEYISNKLSSIFTHLEKCNIKNILQGDFLFNNESLFDLKFNDNEYIAFKPNTLTYALPKKILLNKKAGIVFHTSYKGNTLSNIQQTPFIDTIQSSKDIWFANTSVYTKPNKSLLKDIELAISIINRHNINANLLKDTKFIQEIKRFINHSIKNNITLHIENFTNEFNNYYANKLQNEISSKKLTSEKAINNRYEKIKNMHTFVINNSKDLKNIINVYLLLTQIKHNIMTCLHPKDNMLVLKSIDNIYYPTNVEGFVSTYKGHTIKLINRYEFSRLNFLNNIN